MRQAPLLERVEKGFLRIGDESRVLQKRKLLELVLSPERDGRMFEGKTRKGWNGKQVIPGPGRAERNGRVELRLG